MELYVIGGLLYVGIVVLCGQKIVERGNQAKAAKAQAELERHAMKMKMIKMQREKDILEGKNKCHNVSVDDLL